MKTEYIDSNLNPLLEDRLSACNAYFKLLYVDGNLKKKYDYRRTKEGTFEIQDLQYFMDSDEKFDKVKEACHLETNAYDILYNKESFGEFSLWNNKTFYKLTEIQPELLVKELLNGKYWTLGFWEYRKDTNELVSGAKYAYRKNNEPELDNFMFGFDFDSVDSIKKVDLDFKLSDYFEIDKISLKKLLDFLPKDREQIAKQSHENSKQSMYDFLWEEKTWYHSLLPIIPIPNTF